MPSHYSYYDPVSGQEITDCSVNEIQVDQSCNCIFYPLDNYYHLDVAVIANDMPGLNLKPTDDHVVDLDLIDITEQEFKNLFYVNNMFSVTPKYRLCVDNYHRVSFLHRTVDNRPFRLIDTIIKFIEVDLCITKDMLTTCSLINLNKCLTDLHSLCELKLTSVKCSLCWDDIISLLRSKYEHLSVTPPIVLTISVVFLSQNPDVKPVVVKFNYKTTIELC